MKKALSILLAALMILSMAACGDSKKDEEKAFDAKAAADALLKEAEFSDCSFVESDQVELEYGITLEDTAEFYYARKDSNMSANMFLIAVAKDGKTSLMNGELDKLVETYDKGWTELVYNADEAAKVQSRFVEKKDGVYICIISSDNDAMKTVIGK